MNQRLVSSVALATVTVATPLVILAVSLVPFLNPVWVSFEQGRAEATAWTGYTGEQLRTATDGILADLVLGPPDFAVAVAGEPVLNDRERSHMRDVRTVFAGFAGLAGVALVVLIGSAGIAAARGAEARRAWWTAAGRGAGGLAVGVVALGAVALVAFDALFEAFHRLFFAGGSYTFDPRSERLVQLFPFRFWQETAVAVGVVIVALSAAGWLVARRRSHEPDTLAPSFVLPPAGQRAR